MASIFKFFRELHEEKSNTKMEIENLDRYVMCFMLMCILLIVFTVCERELLICRRLLSLDGVSDDTQRYDSGRCVGH